MANSNYTQKIALAIAFIKDNLDKSIGLDDIASYYYFSAYHFHRIFSEVMRETLSQYVARRRLGRAVNLLLFQRALSITDIALCCGYSSIAISKDVIFEAPFSISKSPQGKNAALHVKGSPEDVQQAKQS